MIDPLRTEHDSLVQCSERLIDWGRGIGERLRPVDDVSHGQHYDFSERLLSLSLYLNAAISSLSAGIYPAAYTLIRSALEHHLMDRLLMLGDRYRRRWTMVPRTAAEQLRAQWDAREEGTHDILEIAWNEHRNQRDVGELVVVRSGVHETGNVRTGTRTLSRLYVLLFLQRYDPFLPRSRNESTREHPFADEETMDRWIAQNRAIYDETRWGSLADNLVLNELNTADEVKKLAVHYRFLSAFTHPYPSGWDEVFGRNRPSQAPRYDHYNSELGLLYVTRIAADSISDFKLMTEREPRVELDGWGDIEEWLSRGRALTAHLWFPGDSPHPFDRFEEANARSFAARRVGPVPAGSRPDELSENEIRYYTNPLRRLRDLHRSTGEMTTGLRYESPWPRSDAWP